MNTTTITINSITQFRRFTQILKAEEIVFCLTVIAIQKYFQKNFVICHAFHIFAP